MHVFFKNNLCILHTSLALMFTFHIQRGNYSLFHLYHLEHYRIKSLKFSSYESQDGRSKAFTAVKIQVEVFWIVTPCNVV
jgi:hypothetical protein